MKKIIDGALYNTDSARKIGYWSNNCNPSDFNWCDETLYRTKSGKSFIHGEGGAMSKYAVSSGNNSWSGGSHIEPLTPAAALTWAEEHLSVDEYAAEFGEPEEAADGREALNISISADTKRKLDKLRGETGKSISKIIEEYINKGEK